MDSTIAVIQARMGSSRLPGKMMRPLGERPLIDYALGRLCTALKPVGGVDTIVLATSKASNNDPLVKHVSKQWPQVAIVRGSEKDVLSRFTSIIYETKAKVIVRVTGDCPFINIEAMHRMTKALRKTGADVVNYQPGYEYVDKGLEAVSAEALLRVAKDPDLNGRDREHVTSLMYRFPERYRVVYIESEAFLRRGDIRLTVDTDTDVIFFENLLKLLSCDPTRVGLQKIVESLDQHPDIKNINATSGRKSTRHERARLGFRCDGGTEIGLGHVAGSLRLAKLLARELGFGSEFVVRDDPAALSLIRKAGFAMEVIPKNTSPKQDMANLMNKSEESDWAGVVFNFCKRDLVRYTPLFGLIKKAGLPLIFMDNPVPPSWWMGDLVLNALPHPRYEGYNPSQHPRCLDGLEYFIPPDDEVPVQKRTIQAQIDRILIAMGGSDPSNLTSLVVHGLSEAGFKGHVDIVLGSGCQHRRDVQDVFERSGLKGEIVFDVSDMPKRMVEADLGFSALGLTTYEMAYYHLPACIISGSELNCTAAEQYVRNWGAAEFLGSGHSIMPDDIARWLTLIEKDSGRREKMSDSGFLIGNRVNYVPAFISNVLGEKNGPKYPLSTNRPI